MRKLFLILAFCFALFSQTTLTAGDIAIIGIHGDNPDNFAFVTLVDLESGTEIYFTDSGVKSDGSFRGGEGGIKFTTSTAYSKGTVFSYINNSSEFSAANDANVGNNGFNLSSSGDQVIAFQGNSSSPSFIFAAQSNSTVWQTDATGSTNSALPTGLTSGLNAVAFGAGSGSGSEFDNIKYDESTTTGSKSVLLAAIANNSNWSGSNSAITLPSSNFTVTAGSSFNFSSSPASSNISRNGADISWISTDSATAVLRYGTTTAYSDSIVINSADTSFTQSLSSLLAETTYHYQVKIRKADGSDSTTSSDATFTTLDSFKFTSSPSITNITDNSADYSFTTNTNATAKIIYGTSPNFTDTISLGSSTSFNQGISSLTESTNYNIKVELIEDGTAESLNSDTTAFTTKAAFRFISQPATTVIKRDSVRFAFTSSDSSTAVFYWGLTNSFTDSITISSADTSFNVWATNLNAGTSYVAQAKIIKNSDSSTKLSNEVNFTTAAAFTFSAGPSVSTKSDTTARITLTTNTNSTISLAYGLNKSLNDTLKSSSPAVSHNLDLSNLTAETWYFYRVIAGEDGTNDVVSSVVDSFRTNQHIEAGYIIISEIMYDSKSSSDQEWVELYNTRSDTIDLSGWYITDDDVYPAAGEGDVVIPSGTVIAPGQYLVISWTDLSDYSNEVIANGSSGVRGFGPGLSNSGDNIALYTDSIGTGILVDGSGSIKFNDAAPSNVGKSIERNKSGNYSDTWHASYNNFGGAEIVFGTPGQANSVEPISFTSSPAISAIGLDSAIVSFNTSDSASAVIRYGISSSYTDSITISSAATSFSQVISALSEATEYHYNVTITRMSDSNKLTSSDATFTTATAALTFSSQPIASVITDTTALVKWSTNFNTNSTLFFGTDSAAFDSVSTSSAAMSDSIQLNNLTANTTYYYQLRSTKDADTEKIISSIKSFTTTNIAAIPLTGIYFSEYVEGSSNNKAVEIYNGSGQTIDLKDYIFFQFWNGNGPSANNANIFSIDTSHVLANGGIAVIVNRQASSELLAKADLTDNYSGSFGFTTFNGDDALAIAAKYSYDSGDLTKLVFVDIIGKYGEDPGSEWSNNGVGTKDETLRRKSSVTNGIQSNPSAFDPSSEWTSFPQNTYDGLGERNTVVDISFTSSPSISAIGLDSAIVSFSTSDSASAVIRYGISSSYTDSITISSAATSFSQVISALSEATEYHYNVTITRMSDSNKLTSSDATFTTGSSALSFTGQPIASVITDTTALVKWSTNFNTNSTLFFGTDSAAFDSVSTSSAAMSDSIQLNNLTANTTYYYQLRSTKDADTEKIVSSIKSFKTTNSAAVPLNGIYFSEYVEGSSNNKAVEIYNGSGQTIDLKDYIFFQFWNGNGPSANNANIFSIDTSHVLANGGIAVIVNRQASSELLAKADLIDNYSGSFGFTTFNGDDALAIAAKYSYDSGDLTKLIFVDIIGKYGEDPGSEWSNNGVGTKDETLRRKSSVTNGIQSNPSTFDPSSEWTSFPQNTYNGLGERNTVVDISFTSSPSISAIGLDSAIVLFNTSDSASAVIRYGISSSYTDSITISNAATNFSQVISGLSEATEYHYNVTIVRKSDSSSLTSSNATFTTGTSSLIFTSQPMAINITDTSAQVKWATNFNSNSTLFFGTDSAAFDSLSTSSASMADTLQLTGLTSNTKYYYQLRSINDGDAEKITSTIKSFTTTNSGSIPTNGLIISEYIEGSSNNKAIEIYNGTGQSIDLKNYAFVLFGNGSSTFGNSLTFDHSKILANGSVYVIANSRADAGILNKADTTSTLTFYNGDDDIAIMLRSNFDSNTMTFIDYFGQRGVDPGSFYEGNGVQTQNKTLRRKSTITAGDTNDQDAFDPSLEWDQFDIDTFDGLGSHSANPNAFRFTTSPSVSNIKENSAQISFVTSDSATAVIYYGLTSAYGDSIVINSAALTFSQSISGLTTETKYHLLVKATKKSGTETVRSNNISFTTSASGSGSGTIFPGLYGQALITALRDSFKTHTDLGYSSARDQMFGFVDNYNDTVYLVYTGHAFKHRKGTGRPNTSSTNVNTEHTWPQSKGASGIRRSDIHHLYPTFVNPNSARGSNPFNDINDNSTEKWWISNTPITSKPSSNIDAYSESTSSNFEPREVQKGNTARAMFYFYTMYQNDGIDTTWFRPQVKKLQTWHKNDPADNRELIRNQRIKQVQGNENPFIIDPTLVDRILSNQAPAFDFAAVPTVKNITGTSATISFITNSSATAKVFYGESASYTDSVIISSPALTFNVALTGLNVSTAYHYKVAAIKSGSSEKIESTDKTFTTSSSSGFTSIDDIVNNFSTYNGKAVKVTGILLNDFGKLQANRTNVHIVSKSGKAINVNSTTLYKNLSRADSIIVSGTISSFRGVYQINPSTAPVVVDSNRMLPKPITTTVNAIKNIQHHGDYVRVVAKVADKYATGSSGTNIEITDGSTDTVTVRVWSTTGINVDAVEAGKTYSFYGASATFNNAGQILPSVQSDIVAGDDQPDALRFTKIAQASEITDKSAKISWATNIRATARIDYGKNTLDQSIRLNTADTNFTQSISGLVASTTYKYRVTVFANNDSLKSTNLSFTTAADPFVVSIKHQSYHYSTEKSLSNVVRFNIGFNIAIKEITSFKAIFKSGQNNDTSSITPQQLSNKLTYQALYKAKGSGELKFLVSVKDQLDRISTVESKLLTILSGKSKVVLANAIFRNEYESSFTFIEKSPAAKTEGIASISDRYTVVMNGQKAINLSYDFNGQSFDEDYKVGLYKWNVLKEKWEYYGGQGKNSVLELNITENGYYQVFYNSEKTFIPEEFALGQNYPNPFNPSTIIPFDLKEKTKVELVIYNALGQKVKTLVNTVLPAGRQEIKWNGTNSFNRKIASGIYFYQLKLVNKIFTKKMILVK